MIRADCFGNNMDFAKKFDVHPWLLREDHFLDLLACVRVYSRINREYISLAKPQGAAEGKHMNAKLPFSAKADFATRAQTTDSGLVIHSCSKRVRRR